MMVSANNSVCFTVRIRTPAVTDFALMFTGSDLTFASVSHSCCERVQTGTFNHGWGGGGGRGGVGRRGELLSCICCKSRPFEWSYQLSSFNTTLCACGVLGGGGGRM